MSARATWERLPPTARRALVLGGGSVLLLGLAALVVGTPPSKSTPSDPRQRLVQNLLTDADPRALGLEGLADQLRRLEARTDRLAAGLEQASGADPEHAATLERLRAEQARALEALRAEIAGLRPSKESTASRPAGAPDPVPAPPSRPRERPAPEKTLERLFEAPPPVSPAGPPGPERSAAKPLEIRVVSAAPAATETGPESTPDTVLIPAGSLLRGVLLTGMDAPTGRAARRDP